MKKRINISIDSEIHERAQRHAFRKGISLSNLIETELSKAIKQTTEMSISEYPGIWARLNTEQRSHLIQYMCFLADKGNSSDLPFVPEGIGSL